MWPASDSLQTLDVGTVSNGSYITSHARSVRTFLGVAGLTVATVAGKYSKFR